jgi:hypothetical protein
MHAITCMTACLEDNDLFSPKSQSPPPRSSHQTTGMEVRGQADLAKGYAPKGTKGVFYAIKCVHQHGPAMHSVGVSGVR